MKKRTIGLVVENRAGVLARVAGLFGRRGYNIESIAVCTTENPSLSRMTIVANADEHILEQIIKQLNKLIDVVKVSDITDDELIDRELALIRVSATPANRAEVLQIVDIFRAQDRKSVV